MFIGYFACVYAMSHRAEFMALVARDFPTTPLSQLVVCVNQEVYPHVLSACLLRELRAEDCVSYPEGTHSGTLSHIREILDSVKARPEEMTLIKTTTAITGRKDAKGVVIAGRRRMWSDE